MKCSALTAKGAPCRNQAAAGDDRCRVHRRELGELEALAVSTLVESARESWQAAAWLLERRFPERWARSARGKPEESPADSDALDELAGRRASRRARSIGG